MLLPPPPPLRLRAPRMLCRKRRKVGGALGPLQTEEMAFERATNEEEEKSEGPRGVKMNLDLKLRLKPPPRQF